MSGISTQTQTRTISKRNKRTQTVDDICSHEPDIALSLCGENTEDFDKCFVTFDQIANDIEILNNPDLIVRCGNDHFFWNQTPNEVLIAMAFRESRPSIEDEMENERDRSLMEDVEDEIRGPKYIKTVRLSSDELASLELNDGPNVITFSVTTSYQVGTIPSQCEC